MLLRSRVRVLAVLLAVLLAGMAATFSGSGFLLAAVGLVVVVGRPRRAVLARYVAPALAAVVLGALTPFGRTLLARVVEVGVSGSSASLRAVQPTRRCSPTWFQAPWCRSSGSAPARRRRSSPPAASTACSSPPRSRYFSTTASPTDAVLAALLVTCHRHAASRAIAIGLFVSLWSVQPGLTTTVLIVFVVVGVSLWGP